MIIFRGTVSALRCTQRISVLFDRVTIKLGAVQSRLPRGRVFALLVNLDRYDVSPYQTRCARHLNSIARCIRKKKETDCRRKNTFDEAFAIKSISTCNKLTRALNRCRFFFSAHPFACFFFVFSFVLFSFSFSKHDGRQSNYPELGERDTLQ